MILIKIYYNDETEQEANIIYKMIREIKEERKRYGDSNINIVEFSKATDKLNITEFPCLIINNNVIHKKKIFGKTLNYTKGYLETQINSTY